MISQEILEKADRTTTALFNILKEYNFIEEQARFEVKEVTKIILTDNNKFEYRINEIVRAITAMANVNGGIVLLGPKDGNIKNLIKDKKYLEIDSIQEICDKIKDIINSRIEPSIAGLDPITFKNGSKGCIVYFVPSSNTMHAAKIKTAEPDDRNGQLKPRWAYYMRTEDRSPEIPPVLLPGFIKYKGVPLIKIKKRLFKKHNSHNFKCLDIIIENTGSVPLKNMQINLINKRFINLKSRSQQDIHSIININSLSDFPFLKVIYNHEETYWRAFVDPGYVLLPNFKQRLFKFNIVEDFKAKLIIYGDSIPPQEFHLDYEFDE